MKIEVDGEYLTRDGSVVKITAKRNDDQTYAYVGKVLTGERAGRSYNFDADGCFSCQQKTHDLTLAEGIIKETSLKPVWKKKNAEGPPWGGWECVMVGENHVS